MGYAHFLFRNLRTIATSATAAATAIMSYY